MNIPMKYEDVVAKLDAALAREAELRKWKETAWRYSQDRDALQQRLIVAEQRAGIMERALERISRPLGCGCLPCHGDCTSTLALEITVEEMQETAKAALKPAAEGEGS